MDLFHHPQGQWEMWNSGELTLDNFAEFSDAIPIFKYIPKGEYMIYQNMNNKWTSYGTNQKNFDPLGSVSIYK